ncbi:uncharacterized protein LOC116413117 [Galleria mellonella]|uniref:Uncharacterized protein LOC116413117 n=1 Tax=Galleria mellonella TaxID=7137 RepID=A0ABM3M8Q5_GALME|nr:uncharacterized protein LOC116413117 [Galleria mellonella]
MREPGLALEVKPASGVLSGLSRMELTVRVYADCWGLYRDQVIIQIEHLEPIIIDVWVEAVGAPLHFSIKQPDDESPTLWMSASDAHRTVRARNTSRSRLDVHAYIIREHEHLQEQLPFRLYLRFFDVPSRVEPQVCTIEPNTVNSWNVTLVPSDHGMLASNTTLLLRCVPLDNFGKDWYRPDPKPQLVHLKQAARDGHLRLPCREVSVKLCALDLPFSDVMRVRKSFQVQNIGSGPLYVTAKTEAPWSIVQEENDDHARLCGTNCGCHPRMGNRLVNLPLHLEPRSSLEKNSKDVFLDLNMKAPGAR